MKYVGYRILGWAGVDSGTLMVVDPCYVLPDKSNKGGADLLYENAFGDNDSFFNKIPHAGEVIVKGPGGNGTIFSTYDGDGNYPIIGLLDERGSIRRVIVDLDFTFCTENGLMDENGNLLEEDSI